MVVVGALFALAILMELPFVNGPSYWQWPWRTLPFGRALTFFAAPLVLYGYLISRWTRGGEALAPNEARRIVGGLVLCCMLAQIASLYVDERTWTQIERIVKSRAITSYYTDARRIGELGEWLPKFATVRLEHHSATHPPGPVLYYYAWIQLAGRVWAPLMGGATVGVLASFGVAVSYLFAGLWTRSPSARLGTCFLYALMPGLIVFFPELDQVYPIGAMLLIWFWVRSFEERSLAIALGLTLFACSFFAYNFLTVGAAMVLFALATIRLEGWSRDLGRRIATAAAIALAVALACHVVLWLTTSFHAIDSLRDALATQDRFAAKLARPYWSCVFWDLYDFLLANGLLTLPLVTLLLLQRPEPRVRALTAAALLAILVVDFTGLLRCEAARVWLFLQPLILVPAGLALARFAAPERAFILALQAVILIALRCKMAFIGG